MVVKWIVPKNQPWSININGKKKTFIDVYEAFDYLKLREVLGLYTQHEVSEFLHKLWKSRPRRKVLEGGIK